MYKTNQTPMTSPARPPRMSHVPHGTDKARRHTPPQQALQRQVRA